MAPNAPATTSAMRITAAAEGGSLPPPASASSSPPQPSEKEEVEQEDLLLGFLSFIDGNFDGGVDADDVDATAVASTVFPPSPYSSASEKTYVPDYSSHLHSHSYNQSSFVVDDTPSPTSSSTTLTIDEEELLLTEPIGAVDFTEHEVVGSTLATTSTAAAGAQPFLLPDCGVSNCGIYHQQQRPLGPPLPLPRVDGGGGFTNNATTISSFHQQAQAATCPPVPGPGPVPFLTMEELFRKVQQDRLRLQQQQQQNQQTKQQMRMVSYPTSSDEAMSSSTSMSKGTSSPFSTLQDSPAKMIAIWRNDGQDKDTEPNNDLSSLSSSNAEQQHQERFRRSSTASTSSSISTKSSTSSSSSPVLADPHERRQLRQQRQNQHHQQQEQHPQQTHTPKFRDYQTEQWFERYEELVKFYEDRGHSSVPHTDTSNKPLARWVKRQRYQYKLRYVFSFYMRIGNDEALTL